jgi:hypothetical protein
MSWFCWNEIFSVPYARLPSVADVISEGVLLVLLPRLPWPVWPSSSANFTANDLKEQSSDVLRACPPIPVTGSQICHSSVNLAILKKGRPRLSSYVNFVCRVAQVLLGKGKESAIDSVHRLCNLSITNHPDIRRCVTQVSEGTTLNKPGCSIPSRDTSSSGAHPDFYLMGTRDSIPRAKADGAWSRQPTPINCRCHEWWRCTSTPPYVFMAWCLSY